MERESIIENIKEILISILDHKDFIMSDDLSAKDVDGWDSLSHIMIISSVEKKFNIRFKLRELNSLDNLKSLVDLIQSKQSNS